MAYGPCEFASLLPRPARCTSAAPAPRCTTGCSPAAPGRQPLVLRIEDTDRERSTPENVEQILDALRWLEPRLGRGPDLPVRARGAPPRGARRSCSTTGHAYHSNATADDVKAYKAAPRRRSRLPRRARGDRARCACASPTTGDTVVRRRRSAARSAFPNAQPRRPGDRPRRRLGALQLRRRGRRPRRRRSPTSSAARTTSRTRPSSCSCSRRWARPPPRYAHLPLLHGPDGRKLSKRHGAASVQELRDAGYLPEAVRQLHRAARAGFAARRGVLHDRRAGRALPARAGVQEPGRVRRAASCAGLERPLPARALRVDELTRAARGVHRPHRPAGRGRDLARRRSRRWPTSGRCVGFLFDGPADDPAAFEQGDRPRRRARRRCRRARARAGDRRAVRRSTTSRPRCAASSSATGCKPGKVFQPRARRDRRARPSRPGIFESVALLGRDETLARIDAALDRAGRRRTRLKAVEHLPIDAAGGDHRDARASLRLRQITATVTSTAFVATLSSQSKQSLNVRSRRAASSSVVTTRATDAG